jgi:hypothetical protein
MTQNPATLPAPDLGSSLAASVGCFGFACSDPAFPFGLALSLRTITVINIHVGDIGRRSDDLKLWG